VDAFSKELGVTQATIRRALKDLKDAGYVDSHVGRGTFVVEPQQQVEQDGRQEPVRSPFMRSSFMQPPLQPVDPEFALAARRLRMGIAKSLEDLTVLTRRPGLIHFTSGVPDPSIARDSVLEQLTHKALEAGQAAYEGYGDPLGSQQLRAAIAARLSAAAEQPIGADQVLVTNGSQQAVSLLAQAALEEGRRVFCETPCYMGIPRSFGAIGHWVESVPRDDQGPILTQLERYEDPQPSVLYLCPELHNPMGTDLSAERRPALIRWAQARDTLLIADEIFHDLRFEPPFPPSLLQAAGPDRAVVIGSVSKAFMCGLRAGWLATSPERVRSLAALKRAMDIGSPPLMQGIALELLRSGEYDAHLERARHHYRVRRDAMLDALQQHLPDEVSWTTPRGGFHMWVRLPEGYSSIALFLLAIERGVAILPGPQLDIDHRFINAFALRYGACTVEQIREGIELLADATAELLRHPPTDPGLSGLGAFSY